MSLSSQSLKKTTPPLRPGPEASLDIPGTTCLVAVLIHELSVGFGHNLESFVHRLLCGEEGGAEVQGALLLAETASRHEHDARLIQNL